MPSDELATAPASLAAGTLSERDAAELDALKKRIAQVAGFDCTGYKEKCLRRRIAVRMRALGVHGYAAYADLLSHDDDERRRLVETVTINVSKFVRNREVWDLLRTRVLPDLLARRLPELRIWSAGCAAGEEIYSVAMLLLELDPARHQRIRLLGTDLDRSALDDARRGEYTDLAFGELPDTMRRRWFEGPGLRKLRPEVRALASFEPLDLMRDAFPTDQHLILCRNVVIYFERSVQNRIFTAMHGTLAADGYLVLGKVETLFGDLLRRFETVSGRDRVFRRS